MFQIDKVFSMYYALTMGKKKTGKGQIKKIINLRQRGYSLPEISRVVRIPKTTVYRYIKDIKILPRYLSEWAGKRGGSIKRKRIKEKLAFLEGIKFVGELSKREKILFLCALYWAEGSKKDFSLSNTDPQLVKVFVSMLRETWRLDNSRLRISVRMYEDLDREKCLSYWAYVVGIPKDKFVGVNILSGKKKGKLEYGMCRVRVLKGGDLLKKINGINKAIGKIYAPIAQLERAPRS